MKPSEYDLFNAFMLTIIIFFITSLNNCKTNYLEHLLVPSPFLGCTSPSPFRAATTIHILQL